MKKIITCIVLISLLYSCNKPKSGSLIVSGTIDGLKKGTLYLQKFKDTVLVSVDSVSLNGASSYILIDEIESPEIYYLTLDKKTDQKISFFGEKGEITINSKLSKFVTAAKISGSKNQTLLEEHNAMIRKFSNKQLDLIKEKFDAQKNNDTALLSKLEKEETSLIKRKYYFSTNFAVINAKYEVAPYIALTELYYANIRLLDTINNSLSKKVKLTKYGSELDDFIKSIKETEE
ncbi:MAG: thiol:disulfide interchange protein [Lutibacter sp.]|nr:MAG: thiol:disulfide interchange protein [Lutibacter sp.]